MVCFRLPHLFPDHRFGRLFTLFRFEQNDQRFFRRSICQSYEGSFLHIDITGQITSYNEYSDNLFTEPEVSAQELINKIDYAATDEKISGILLEPHTILSGYADLNEIMAALERFRATDKKVYSYLDMATNKDYFNFSNDNF